MTVAAASDDGDLRGDDGGGPAAATSVTVTATYGSATQAATLAVAPVPVVATLASVSLNPASVVGGASSTGTVTLSSAAPAGGAVVALASSNMSAAPTVPGSVTVAAGATTADLRGDDGGGRGGDAR